MEDSTVIIGNQARELMQSVNTSFPQTPFGQPGHNTHTLFAQDGFFTDILDTEFGPGTALGSGRGMNELGRLFFKRAYDEDTDLIGVAGFRYALMDICPGGGNSPYNFAY